ncbi:hypothetical protein [Streptomyces tirandamycinicus]|uniref:hypothetical protein n=1 Tax=Streptomyces tirandamycinicus TaxID=2174846 RepID=UPI001ABF5E3A|nr:hypothetical protein [Streptomyces tirandamycinicus]
MTQPSISRRVRGRRPRMLDPFSCAAGAAVGYALAIPPAYTDHGGTALLATATLGVAA